MPFIDAALTGYGPDGATVVSNRDILFVHVQKTGGSSILRALGQDPHPRHKHCFAAEFRQMCTPAQWDGAFKFAFVRNPWDRLVSWWSMIDAYRDAFRRGARMNRFFTYVLENSATFEEFILNCQADIADPDGRKCILRNQLDYLTDSDGRLLVDYIGRFENLAADFTAVTRQLGLPDIALEHRNRTTHAPYADYYTDRTRAVVERAYQRDIARFGYAFGQHTGT
jgi:chondroitin 4-sulfotransferase 11